jgi:TetR/AcrR family transcriptional repressor of nem operon
MARPREFNAEDALEKAMQLFWAKGYEATSLADLTSAMGLSKSSLYDTFGCKHELFLSAMDRYNETVAVTHIAGLIDGAKDRRAGIAAVFCCLLDDMLGAGEKRGCFVNNSAVELAPHDAAVAARAAAGLAHVEEAFYRAVRQGQEAGDIARHRDARALARYLAASLNGLIVLAKTSPERAALEEVVGIVLAALD